MTKRINKDEFVRRVAKRMKANIEHAVLIECKNYS